MGAGLFIGQEKTGGFDDDFGADFVPLKIGGLFLSGQTDLLAVDDEVGAFHLDVAGEAAVHGIVAQHVSEILGFQKVVDADDLDVVREVLDRRAENHAADAAEAIDTNFDCHK